MTIRFKNGNEQTVKLGDPKLDASSVLDKGGLGLDVKDASYQDALAKFGEMKELDEAKDFDIPTQLSEEKVVNSATVINVDSKRLYTTNGGVTQTGKDFIEAFRAFNLSIDEKDNKNVRKPYNDGNTAYSLLGASIAPDTAKITKIGNKYILVIEAKNVVDANDSQRKYSLEFRIMGNTQSELTVIKDYLFSNKDIVVGKFNRLIGDDRYQTAVEVSKTRFKEDGSADSVVIVGGNALLDGLSAAPLASAKNAAVLLASPRTRLSQSTQDEIKRAVGDKIVKRTVYIIGGTDSVPASVDKVLSEKFGAVVIRIAGADRYETSRKIAERLYYDGDIDTKNGMVFYVGGNGAPDAMSIAPVAATKRNIYGSVMSAADKDTTLPDGSTIKKVSFSLIDMYLQYW